MTAHPALPDVATSEEAARYLRVSKATLLRLVNRGLIPAAKIGRQWRFSKKTIRILISSPDFLRTLEARL